MPLFPLNPVARKAAWAKAAGHAASASALLAGDPCRCGDPENCPYEDAQQSTAMLAQAHAAAGHLWAVLAQSPRRRAPRASRP